MGEQTLWPATPKATEDKVEGGKDQYVEYDVSGKVTKVYSGTEKTEAQLKIENLYDDRGFRLAKINHATSKTTWYTRFEEKTSYARDFNLAALASLLGNTLRPIRVLKVIPFRRQRATSLAH